MTKNNKSDIASYIKTLRKDHSVASVAPTSITAINKLLKTAWFSNASLVVEYGPGGGVISQYILDNIPEDCLLMVIETNKDFVQSLKDNISDPRLIIKHGSAANVNQYINELLQEGKITHPKAQYIVSGIPFSMFPIELKDEILNATKEALEEDGAFFVYQFLLSLSFGKNDIKQKLNSYFKIVRSELEFMNIPPLRIYEAHHKNFHPEENE